MAKPFSLRILDWIKEQEEKSIMTISITADSGNPTATINNTWIDNKLNLNTQDYKKGQTFSHSNNAILINKKCRIAVSGQLMVRGINNSYKIFTIRRNRNRTYTRIASGYAQESSNFYSVITLANKIIDCEAGDIIEACVGAGVTGTLEIGSGSYSFITIQEI